MQHSPGPEPPSAIRPDLSGVTRNRLAERRRAIITWSAGFLSIAAAAALAVLVSIPFGIVAVITIGLAVLWGFVAHRWMLNPGGFPVLTWHSVSDDPAWLPWATETSVTPQTLDRQLTSLRAIGCKVIDTDEFVRRRVAGQTIPPETVVLHFDDGYLDNWVAAAPILERHGVRATLFVSLDFVAPDGPVRPTLNDREEVTWQGYLNWREIEALDAGAFSGAFTIEAHGVAHGRVPISDRIVDRLSESNWRSLAWMQWAETPGDKSHWYEWSAPPAIPIGSPVPESGGALAARAFQDGKREAEAAFRARVRRDLTACVDAFITHLGRAPRIFCWPQNLTAPDAHRLALELGYEATTGGRGANRPGEDPRIISRLHVGERVLGMRCPWADDLFFRASIRAFRGNYYWYMPILAMSSFRRIVRAVQRGRTR